MSHQSLPARLFPILALSLCGPALAFLQPGTVTIGGRQWKPADPTISDLNPIGASHRVMPVDLRMATNFEKLYELDSKPTFFGGPVNEQYYMRMNGGILAVFPRSTYAATKRGVYATVPPGAVYSLGGENLDHLLGKPPQPEPTPDNDRRIDHSAKPRQPDQTAPRTNTPMPAPLQRPDVATRPDYRVRPDAVTTSEQPAAQPGTSERPVPNTEARPRPTGNVEPMPHSIWYDEPYRQTRISELLDQASGRR